MRYKGLSCLAQAFVATIGLTGAAVHADNPPPLAQVQYSGIERVVAFADVHGANSELQTLLRETGLVDAQDRWATCWTAATIHAR
jgi:hypothetical protein